ncbi:DUF7000 family protein [Sporocytophaga myxococcoides]|uniref:DUF7000 family protein n=1 Tax=Sporocytophaga myxococcoides TaxID=153721 RepID=UPI0004036347|nr:hypothetical protein [Sporocytophaga myxococcoides]
MKPLNNYVEIYKEQLDKGDIQEAYGRLVKFVMKLNSSFSNDLADRYSFGNLFQGYMDYTYFYFSDDFLKKRKLRFGLVLNHSKMRFEIWLLGQNIKVQEKYWQILKDTKWNKNRTSRPQYSVLEAIILENPDFNNLDKLTQQLKKSLIKFTDEITEHIQNCKLA